MKSLHGWASGLLLLGASTTASAHDLAGRPHVHGPGGVPSEVSAPSFALTGATTWLPFAICGAVFLLALLRRRRALPRTA